MTSTPPPPHRKADFLAAYDQQLRTDAETPGATTVRRLGPLRLVTFPGGRGFVTYQNLTGAGAEQISEWVAEALDHFRGEPGIRRVEWKTRGHDVAPGLHDALTAQGFLAGETESIMIGEASRLADGTGCPPGVALRRVTSEPDVRRMCAMTEQAFEEESFADELAEGLLARLTRDDGMQLWVAETGDGQMVSAGRLEPVSGTDFAGIWGGGTLRAWRGRGIYRALTAVRAQAALDLGKTLLHSDSTDFSQPILERSGMVKVSTTTPYEWVA